MENFVTIYIKQDCSPNNILDYLLVYSDDDIFKDNIRNIYNKENKYIKDENNFTKIRIELNNIHNNKNTISIVDNIDYFVIYQREKENSINKYGLSTRKYKVMEEFYHGDTYILQEWFCYLREYKEYFEDSIKTIIRNNINKRKELELFFTEEYDKWEKDFSYIDLNYLNEQIKKFKINDYCPIRL